MVSWIFAVFTEGRRDLTGTEDSNTSFQQKEHYPNPLKDERFIEQIKNIY